MIDGGITIHTDGGSRGNPGPTACAFVVEKNNQIIFKGSKFLGKATNNIAEYSGVILALEKILSNKLIANSYSLITFLLDSELVVKQLNGLYKVKDENLKKLFSEVKILVSRIDKQSLPLRGKKIIFQHIPREKNKEADQLVNEEMDRNIS